MSSRTNAEWLELLSDPSGNPQVIEELAGLIRRSVPLALAAGPDIDEGEMPALVEKVTATTLADVLARLEEFHGKSRFTTWVLKYAVYHAFKAARRLAAAD